MMADNVVLARGLFCMLMAGSNAREIDAPPRPLPQATPPLEAVEKARLLRHAPTFSRASVDQLIDLVAIADEVPLVAGTELFGARRSSAVYYVLEGTVALERPDAPPLVIGPGATIGLTETLAGRALAGRARVVTSGYALRLEQGPLFEVLADHGDLLQGLFSGVLRAGRNPRAT
jgi:hypothetical protein